MENIELTSEYIRAQFDKVLEEFLKERNQTTLDRVVDVVIINHHHSNSQKVSK
jgi:hypothetical protein